MGGGGSKPTDISQESLRVLEQCSEAGRAELRAMVDRMQKMKEDYVRHKRLPFDTRENPEVDALRGAFTTRIILGNLGGAGLFYFVARSLTRYEPRLRRTVVRLASTFVGGFIGLSWSVSTGLPPFALGYLEKSNWAPRVLCQPIHQFKPCLEDYGCRSILDAEPSGRLFIECYQVCQRRADLWQQQGGGMDGAGGDGGGGGDGGIGGEAPTEMYDAANAFEAPAMAEEEEVTGEEKMEADVFGSGNGQGQQAAGGGGGAGGRGGLGWGGRRG